MIKKYKDFDKINELYSLSDGYEELLSKYKDNDYFKEMFYNLTDDNICKVRIYNNISDEDGRNLGLSQSSVPNLNKKHYISTGIQISIGKTSFENYDELKQNNTRIGIILDTIESFKSRVTSDGLSITDIKTLSVDSLSYIHIDVRGGEIDKIDMKISHDKYINKFGPNYQKGLEEISNSLKNNDINTSMDMIETTPGNYDIALLDEYGDIFIIAKYDKRKENFEIDYRELEIFIEDNKK